MLDMDVDVEEAREEDVDEDKKMVDVDVEEDKRLLDEDKRWRMWMRT